MRNESTWKATKFELVSGRLRASREHVGSGSLLMADLLANVYERLLREYARGDLLDVGCGHAPLYMIYKPRVRRVVLVDWEHSFHFNPLLDVTCDLNREIAWEGTAAFDTIVATDLLEHLHHPEVLFSESARLLRPGGHLVLGVPFLYWIHEQPHDYHRYTAHRLRQLCDEHGLIIESLETVGGAGEVILDVTAKIVASYHVLAAAHRLVTRMFLATPLARRLRSTTSENFPLAYALVARK